MSDKSNFEMFDLVGDRRRVLEGNSAFGYTPQSALADLIDNSIANNANVVRIDVSKGIAGSISVQISDDGDGMSPEKLQEAMAFGSSQELITNELSKFGFGMKTASMEMSKSGFTVFTRSIDGIESCAAIELEDQSGSGHIQARWYPEPHPRFRNYLNRTSENDSGTVIIWHDANLKEADHFKNVVKGTRDDMLRRVANRIVPHLGLVFHRWITGENSEGRKVKIIYADQVVEAWNPLEPEWADSSRIAEIPDLEVSVRGEKQTISFRSYVIDKAVPTKGKDHPSRKSEAYQGIYVYRMDRLISGPEWFGLSTRPASHPTLNALRFEVDVPTSLDEWMMLDVKKSTVDFPQELVDYFEPIVHRYCRIEESDYESVRKKSNKQVRPDEAIRRVENHTKALEKKDPFAKPERVTPTEVITTTEDGQRFPLRARLHPGNKDSGPIELVEAHETQGFLWEPMTTASDQLIIRVNQDHDFYQKVILPAEPEAQTGILELLIAFARAEFRTHGSDFRLQWVHARQHVSQTLAYFAEDIDLPELSGE